MSKLLIVIYGGGHVNIIKRLYNELAKKFDISILALTMAKQALINENIPFRDLQFYKGVLDDTDDIVNIGANFIEKHLIDYSKLGYEDSVLYYGYNVRDYIVTYGDSDLDVLYKEFGRAIFLPLNTMRMIIEYEKPDAVLTTNSPRFERAALLISKEKNITNFSIEDLFGDSRLYSIKEDKVFKNYYGDYIFVFNDMVKEKLINKGIEAKDIIPIGQPAFEDIYSSDAITNEPLPNFDIDTNKKIVLWASHKTNEEKRIFENLVNVFSKSKDKILIIKPHPNENIDYMHETVCKLLTKNIFIIEDINIRDLIKVADVVLTQYSTCGLEAILMNKPLIVLKPNGISYKPDYAELELALQAEDIINIEKDIDLYFNKRNFHANYIMKRINDFKMPHNSSKLISEYIYTTIEGEIL